MSAVVCEIVGTGDGRLKSLVKNEGSASKTIATDLVLEIIDNAMEIVDDTSDETTQKIMNQIPVEEFCEKPEMKEKPMAPLIGTGDQRSNEHLEPQESIRCHPPVEKKNRLTDLVKNSKQILAKIMMSDSKMSIQESKREEEIVDVIELDCVQLCDLPFKCKREILPEEVPLPKGDSSDILTPSLEAAMSDVRLEGEETKETCKKVMTFPRASGSRARHAFAAKCRTLKMGASNLKKKKWDVGGKIANFFKKKRSSNNSSKSARTHEEEFEQTLNSE